MNLPRKRLNHKTPYGVTENSDYFITICAEPRGQNHFCKDPVGRAVLDSVRFYNEKERWFCSIVLLMPDHIHMMICFPRDADLAKVMGIWKRGLTRSHGISWQQNFFEHRLRNDENAQVKSDYILQNPVRAGLVEDWRTWPYYWMPDAY
jgi:putative transposase